MLSKTFAVILNMSITASIAIVVVLLARRLLKRAPKIFSYALWAVVLFRLLCPIALTSWFSLMGFFQAPTTETGRIEYISLNTVSTEAPAITVTVPAPNLNQSTDKIITPSLEEETPPTDSAGFSASVISAIWICGVAAMLAFNIFQLIRLRGKLTGSIPLKGNIYLADYIPTPFVMGIIHPTIYLPAAMSDTGQSYIIQHEKHHIRRGDHIIRLLAFGAMCIHWFNPLVWLAFALSGKDMEMSCDEAVMKQTGRDIRADYSSSLLQFSTGKRVITGMPLAFGEKDTKERIENIMKYKKPTALIVVLAVIVCIGLTACLSSNPQSSSEDFELVSMDEAALLETLRPYLDAYNLCISDDFGAECVDDAYWRCYETEADSWLSYENDPTAVKALIPSGNTVPDGLYVDPAYAHCQPVSNYSSIAEMKDYLGEWIAEDAEFLTTGIATFFFEYEGKVYKIIGAHGSGALRIDPESAALIESTGDNYLVQVDSYLFDEKEDVPVTLTFTTRDGKLMIIGDGRTVLATNNHDVPVESGVALYDVSGDEAIQTGEFPVPIGEAFGLSGTDATLYTAAARAKTAEIIQNIGNEAAASDTMLILPTVSVYGEYDGEDGEKHYICGYGMWLYYDLGAGLSDPRAPVYSGSGSGGSIACITLAADGSIAEVRETYDGADNTERLKEICGPLTDLAAKLNSGDAEARRLVPTGNELLTMYLNYYFF